MRALGVVLCGTLLMTSGIARAQCEKDIDCKGDQICTRGQCTAPTAPAPVAPAAQPPVAPAPVAQPPAAPPETGRRPLKTTRGTLTLSGTFDASPHVSIPLGGTSGSASATTGVEFNLSPGIGIFVAKHFALELDLDLTKGVGDYYNNEGWSLGADFGFGVYPNLGTFGALYVRLLVGPHVFFPAGSSSDSTSNPTVDVNFTIPFGVLIAVNEHVAIDVGLRIETTVWFAGKYSGLVVQVPIGYFGVRSFF